MRHHEETLSTVEPIYVKQRAGSDRAASDPVRRLRYLATRVAARRGAGQQVSYWRQQLLHGFNDIAAQTLPQDLCAHQLFEEQGARTPEAVALVHEGEQLSYAELNGRANQLAHYLRRSGVGVETVVGLCLPRASIR